MNLKIMPYGIEATKSFFSYRPDLLERLRQRCRECGIEIDSDKYWGVAVSWAAHYAEDMIRQRTGQRSPWRMTDDLMKEMQASESRNG